MSKKRKVYTGPIHPGEGIGEIRLGMTPLQVIRILGEPDKVNRDDGISMIMYPGLSLGFNSDICDMIVAEDSTQPPDPSGVYIGMPWRELVKIHPRIQYDKNMAAWRSPDLPGVWYSIVRPAPESPDWDFVSDEMYVVSSPDQAYVYEIYIMTDKHEDDS